MVAITVRAQEPGTDCQGALHERVPHVTERWWLECSEEKEKGSGICRGVSGGRGKDQDDSRLFHPWQLDR